MNKALKDFKASLSFDKGKTKEEIARCARQLDDYNTKCPGVIADIGEGRGKYRPGPDNDLWETRPTDSDSRWGKRATWDSLSIEQTQKLLGLCKKKLNLVEAQLDKIFSMYPTEVAELMFTGGDKSKSAIANGLIDKRRAELVGLMGVEKLPINRIYLSLGIQGFNITVDIHKDHRGVYLPRNLKFSSILRFLVNFPQIKAEMQTKLAQVKDIL